MAGFFFEEEEQVLLFIYSHLNLISYKKNILIRRENNDNEVWSVRIKFLIFSLVLDTADCSNT